jgi:hypothetical protein
MESINNFLALPNKSNQTITFVKLNRHIGLFVSVHYIAESYSIIIIIIIIILVMNLHRVLLRKLIIQLF